jgi:repressor LexA
MSALTLRQRQVLEFIEQQQRDTGLPPTSREIQAHFRFKSQTAAMNHLRALARKGVINHFPGRARAAVSPALKAPRISLLGQIPAGLSVHAEQAPDASFSLDLAALGIRPGREVFALRVHGDSMLGAQIADGDTVILEKRSPRTGEIVAALIDGEVTLKRFQREADRVFLKAENPKYPDLIPTTELTIQGVMIGLFRVASGG